MVFPALFGRVWNAENGGEKQAGHPAKVFGISFVFSLVTAEAFGLWLGPSPSIETALRAGLLAGVGFVASSIGITPLWLIDGGYHAAQFVVFGLVFGLLH